jgi:hypothetical protein
MRVLSAALVTVSLIVCDAFADAHKWADRHGWDQVAGWAVIIFAALLLFDFIAEHSDKFD